MDLISIKLRDLGRIISCSICGGFPVDPTLVCECMHPFCKSCLVVYIADHLGRGKTRVRCPAADCGVLLDDSNPYNGIKSDKVLESFLGKINVPLHLDERNRRVNYYYRNPPAPDGTVLSSAEMGVTRSPSRGWTPDMVTAPDMVAAPDTLTVVLRYDELMTAPLDKDSLHGLRRQREKAIAKGSQCRVPPNTSVGEIANFLAMNYRICDPVRVAVLDGNTTLDEKLTMSDIARFRDKPLETAGTLELSFVFVAITMRGGNNRRILAAIITDLIRRKPALIEPVFTNPARRTFKRQKVRRGKTSSSDSIGMATSVTLPAGSLSGVVDAREDDKPEATYDFTVLDYMHATVTHRTAVENVSVVPESPSMNASDFLTIWSPCKQAADTSSGDAAIRQLVFRPPR